MCGVVRAANIYKYMVPKQSVSRSNSTSSQVKSVKLPAGLIATKNKQASNVIQTPTRLVKSTSNNMSSPMQVKVRVQHPS